MKKALCVLLAATMIGVLGGCGSTPPAEAAAEEQPTAPADEEPAAEEPANEEPASEEAADGKLSGEVEILWQIDGAENIWEPTLQYFAENHPDLKITFNKDPNAFETIRNRLASGNAPDIFYTWHTAFDFAGAYQSGVLSPVDDVLAAPSFENDGTMSERFDDVIEEAGFYEGSHYFVPFQKLMYINLYSNKFFTDNGYEMPETWDDYLALCEKIKTDGKAAPMVYTGVYGEMLGNNLLLTEIYNQDPATLEKIYNGESAWSEPAGVKAAEKLETLAKNGYIDLNSLAYDHIQSQIEFIGYKAAMLPGGSWVENEMGEQWPADFDLTPFIIPSETGKKTAIMQTGEIVLPVKENQNREAVIEILRVFFSHENSLKAVETCGLLPAFQELGDEYMNHVSPSAKKIFDMLDAEDATILPPIIEIKLGWVMPEYTNNVNALVEGSIDAKTFCANMDEAMKRPQ